MMSHFRQQCKYCGKILSQCKCLDCNQTIEYVVCDDCKLIPDTTNTIDEILLKPAHWQYDDYQKAKQTLADLLLGLPSLQVDGLHSNEEAQLIANIRQQLAESLGVDP